VFSVCICCTVHFKLLSALTNEDSGLLECHVVSLGEWVLMFEINIVPSS
jgi:hypothetical protein